MNLSLRRSTEQKTIFDVDDTSVAYVNALRRICMKHVPTMAIDEVEVHENDSALFDEILAHRLGLVALNTDVGTFNMPEPDAEPTAATHAELGLNVEGPMVVRAKHLELENDTISPVHPETIIVKLLDGQSITLNATARLGTGDEHSKYDPCLASYYYKPHITVNDDVDNFDDKVNEYPPQVVEDDTIEPSLIDKPELVDACSDVNDAVTVTYDEPATEFIFTIEPWGQLSSQDIVSEAIRVFNDQLDDFDAALTEL